MRSVDARVVAVALTGLLSFLVALPMDFDGDDLATVQEWGRGTRALDADSDGDGLLDGGEVRLGSDPRVRDSDEDGLHDGEERRIGSDPLDADVDRDGVLDGSEGAVACITNADCDADGLPDGLEQDGRFSPLTSDSFALGLGDAVVYAFDAAGQPAAGDEDRDGIPDAWEDAEGLIAWGHYDPQPGRTDLLVEYLKVTGPSSGRFAFDMTAAYQAVADLFRVERGIHLQWVETTVQLTQEHRPGFLEGDDLGFYRDILAQGHGSTNPYVTSIVLNPQQEQEDLAGNVLGAAFLRSMVATVDYGAHVSIVFEEASSDGIVLTGDGRIELSPSMESHILGAPREQLRQIALANEGIVRLGETPDGVFLVTRQDGTDFRWEWRNDWFVTAPNITLPDGSFLQLQEVGATLFDGTLAQTIAHELGHTLGLCHAHEAACFESYHPLEQTPGAIHSSTMSYGAAPGTLHFLASEWQQIDAYLTCPPQDPIRLISTGAGDALLLEAKYETSFMQAQSLRSCGEHVTVTPDLRVDDGIDRSSTGPGQGLAWLYAAATFLVAGIAVWRTWPQMR